MMMTVKREVLLSVSDDAGKWEVSSAHGSPTSYSEFMEVAKRESSSEEESDFDEERYCCASLLISKFQPRRVLSEARWLNELGMAEVQVPRGPIWRTTRIDIVRSGKIYCSIEEVLFLTQLGALLVMDETGASLPMRDLYTKVSDEKNGCCREQFQAYNQLKSLGYVIRPITNSSLLIEEVKRPVFDVYFPNSEFRKSSPGDPSFVLCFTGGYPPSKVTLEVLEGQCESVPLKFCHVEQGRVSFFSFDKVELPVLP
ncbi:tRNA-splicing endonuclease, subunit Sen [Trema orientale]|uniref:tRNA-splicing endonuclease, subunit Sen n=1 Tax=Trema orientale TaxID=63057 RepID=A0A2P5FMF7_TREOI|nr:tRNA-splicing endonuclease, subunit Sen [Trema orientale]